MYEEQKKGALLNEAFSYFYAAINIGSAIADARACRRAIATSTVGWRPGTPRARGYAVGAHDPRRRSWSRRPSASSPSARSTTRSRTCATCPPRRPRRRRRSGPRWPRVAGVFALHRGLLVRLRPVGLHVDLLRQRPHGSAPRLRRHHRPPIRSRASTRSSSSCSRPLFNVLWDLLKRRRGGVDVPDTRKMLLGFFIVIALHGHHGRRRVRARARAR